MVKQLNKSEIKEINAQIEAYGVARMNEHLNATNVILNSKDPAKLAKIVDVISRIPELKIFMTGEGNLDSEGIAKIIIGWVNGLSIIQISQEIKRTGQKDQDILGICNKYINSNMRNFIPWGLSVYQFLTKDSEKNLPSYVYYGVNNKEDVILSKIGVPRFAIKTVRETLNNKHPEEIIDVKNIENVRSKILKFNENDYNIKNFDKKIIKEIIENNI